MHYRVKDRRTEQPFLGCRVGSVLDTWVMIECKGADAQRYTSVYGIPNRHTVIYMLTFFYAHGHMDIIHQQIHHHHN